MPPLLGVANPQGCRLFSRGFAFAEDGSQFLQSARQVVAKTLEGSNQEEKTDWGVMKEKIRADLNVLVHFGRRIER